jgi:hypothetical protein
MLSSVNTSWIALSLVALGISVLGAGCNNDNGCCEECSPPPGACGQGDISGDDGSVDATADVPPPGPDGSTCTSESTSTSRSILPVGSCATGATCVFQMQSECSATENGDFDSLNFWSCACDPDSTWSCAVTGGGLGLYPCDAGPDAAWGGDAAPPTLPDGGPIQK